MRIVQILPALNDGGVERGVVDANKRYVLAGHESWVISAGGYHVPSILRDGGCHVELSVKSKNPLTAPFRMWLLRRTLCQIRPDVIHFRSRVPGWLTLWANNSRGLHFPMVSTLHGLNHPGLYSSVMVRADRVICVSTAGRMFVHKHYSWVPEDRLVTIPRGVDTECFDPDKLDGDWIQEFRKAWRLEGKFIAAAVGRVSALKGIDVLIRAVAELKDEWPELTALVVGGSQKGQEHVFSELQILAKALGVDARVRFVGSQRKIPEIYALADVVCSCNVKKPESFGRTIAEALAMETPVIASAHGGVLDIIRDGQDGFLIPPGNVHALATALKNTRTATFQDLRKSIIRRFSVDKMVEATLKVYGELLASHRR